MRIIAQLALIAAIKDASESIITTIAAMHIVDIHKQHEPSKRLNFSIKQGLNLKLIKERKSMQPSSMHN